MRTTKSSARDTAQRDADRVTRDVGRIRTTVTADMFSMFASATPATPTTPTKKRKMMMFASAADADAIDETNRGRDDDDERREDSACEASPPVTPVKGTPVRVDRTVKGVYRYIDKKTYLDWGLTSDWSVEGPRKRRSIGADGSPVKLEPTPTGVKTEEEEEDENAASEGYGEMTEGSIERLLLLLRDLSSAELDSPLPMRTPEKGARNADVASSVNLTEESSFIDVGSGYGKVVFHAALSARVAKSVGIEYVPSRAKKASEVQEELSRESGPAFMTEEARALVTPPRCVLEQGDATTRGAFRFSHIYMYDRVFNEKTLALLAKQLNRSSFKVLVTYQRVELWRRLGLRNVEHVHSFTMRTTGGQNFKAYIFVKQ